jgi:hypothetical protein
VATTAKPKPQTSEVKSVATKVNFKAVATSFPAREAGDYEVTFTGHVINPASASSGNPTVRLIWSEDASPKKQIMKTYSLMPQALWSLKRDVLRMGANIEDMNDEDADLDDILNSLIGAKSVIIMGEPREGKDKQGNDVMYDNFQEVKDPSKL